MTIAPAIFTSLHQDYNTPREFLDPAREILGPIGLDPCSNEFSTVRARTEWRFERGEDGLARTWGGFGLVFMNPTYNALITWSRKLVSEVRAHDIEALALVPHRTDTVWYQDFASTCDAKVEWRGRLCFPRVMVPGPQLALFAGDDPSTEAEDDAGPSTFPAVGLYWGGRVRRFAQGFSKYGVVWSR